MNTKKCSICKQEKPTTEYNRNKTRKDGLNTLCKLCSRNRSKQYYKENGENHRVAVRQRKLKIKSKNHGLLLKYFKEHPCVDCGNTNPIVLQFDHIDPKKKEYNVSFLLAAAYSWQRILKEISKCEVRCANCHAIKTAKDFGWYGVR